MCNSKRHTQNCSTAHTTILSRSLLVWCEFRRVYAKLHLRRQVRSRPPTAKKHTQPTVGHPTVLAPPSCTSTTLSLSLSVSSCSLYHYSCCKWEVVLASSNPQRLLPLNLQRPQATRASPLLKQPPR